MNRKEGRSKSESEEKAAPAREPAIAPTSAPDLSIASESEGLRTIIHVLVGLVAFMIALIGVVLLARQLRPLIAHNRAAAVDLHDSILQLQVAKSKEQRLAAACEIVSKGPEAVIAALDECTSTGEGESLFICQPAAHAMADVGPAAVDSLCKALSSPKANVRAGAADVLREMGGVATGAKNALAKTLNDQNRWVRWYAAEAFGNMGADAATAVDALLPLVEHKDAFTRRRAVESLGRIGSPAKKAVPALTKVRNRDPDKSVRDAAGIALRQINMVQIAAKAAQQANEEVRELIKKLQGDDQLTSIAAAKSLGEMGPRAADAAPSLALALRHKDKAIRLAAAKALGRLGGSAINIAPSLQAALHDADPDVRAAAQASLAQIEGK
jgi:HEAT repeat protein